MLTVTGTRLEDIELNIGHLFGSAVTDRYLRLLPWVFHATFPTVFSPYADNSEPPTWVPVFGAPRHASPRP